MYCKGTIVRVRQCAGYLEVHVAGEASGSFVIDNCYVAALLDPDGPGLVGRKVEYETGMMRFLDEEDTQAPEPAPIILSLPNTPYSLSPHNLRLYRSEPCGTIILQQLRRRDT
jgi:hypothetical protein